MARRAAIGHSRCAVPHCSAEVPTRCESEFGSDPNFTTRIQSQLFSVGFVASGLSPRGAGFRAVLRVPRRPWRGGNLATSALFRFRFALCSQIIVENRVDLAHAECV